MIKLSTIINELGCIRFIGNQDIEIHKIIQFDERNTDSTALMWVNKKNFPRVKALTKGTVICPDEKIEPLSDCNYIVVEKPRAYFSAILRHFFKKNEVTPLGVAKSARIDSSTEIGQSVFIGENVVIEANCKIGDHSQIGHNTVIKAETIIGHHVLIGSNNTIGGVGFGYERDEDGTFIQILHIGNVIIEDFVEIGNNTCIDRAVLGSTLLKTHCKIDNLVHIAHGVQVGKNALVIANAMVAGSTKVGENAWIAPSASILNKLEIGSNSFIGMAAAVIRDVAEDDIVAGVPAKSIKKK